MKFHLLLQRLHPTLLLVLQLLSLYAEPIQRIARTLRENRVRPSPLQARSRGMAAPDSYLGGADVCHEARTPPNRQDCSTIYQPPAQRSMHTFIKCGAVTDIRSTMKRSTSSRVTSSTKVGLHMCKNSPASIELCHRPALPAPSAGCAAINSIGTSEPRLRSETESD